jgi:hypothetical protein
MSSLQARWRQGQTDAQVDAVGIEEAAADAMPVGLEEIPVIGEIGYRQHEIAGLV